MINKLTVQFMKGAAPLLVLLSTISLQLSTVHAQGTAFTYQGRLIDGANSANGNYDFQFILFATNQFGSPLGPILTNAAVPVNNGLFTTTLDFGSGVFIGTNFWLDISMRTNGGGAFTTLSPRQPLTPAPYAIAAENLAGVMENNAIQGGVSLSTISGGGGNFIQTGGDFSTIGGGQNNTNSGDHATVGGGQDNIGSGTRATVSGGRNNIADGNASSVGGGSENHASGDHAAVAGGQGNLSLGDHAVIGGGDGNAILSGAADSFIGGGNLNSIQADAGGSVIGGGVQNVIQTNAQESTIGGGVFNSVQSSAGWSTIGGGIENTIQPFATCSTVGGGRYNTIQTNGQQSFIGGGYQNTIQTSAQNDFIGGGDFNVIQSNAYASAIGGGALNTNGGFYAAIPGGYENIANGTYSLAAGQHAQALHQGAFVWADSQPAAYSSDRNNQFKIRAGGGIQMDVAGSSGLNPAALAINSTSGNGVGLLVNESSSDTSALFANNGTGDIIKGFSGGGNTVFEVKNDGTVVSKGVTLTSDRNAKENFTALDAQRVLAKVVSLPVLKWNYKDDAADKKHIGPMAQDFQSAFGLNGSDDKHISVVDEGGVALAAIQGLNQKLDEKDSEIQTLMRQNENLEKRLEKLERAVESTVETK